MQIGVLKCMGNFHDKDHSQQCFAKPNNDLKSLWEQKNFVDKENIIRLDAILCEKNLKFFSLFSEREIK